METSHKSYKQESILENETDKKKRLIKTDHPI